MSSGARVPCESCDSTTESNDERKLGISTGSLDDSINDSSSFEKKPDSTYQGSDNPPAYSGFSENNVQNYRPAGTMPDTSFTRLSSPDVSDLPVTALGYVTLYQLSLRLDPEILPAQNWKMMADYMGFSVWEIRNFETKDLKTKAVIDAWSGSGRKTIGELLQILEEDMRRMDVITDLCDLILRDAERHKGRLRMPPDMSRMTSQSPSYGFGFSSVPPSPMSPEYYSLSGSLASGVTQTLVSEKGHVYDESQPVQVPRIEQSTTGEKEYDAFILCNISDKDFVVNEFLPKVEDDAGLRLCFMDRDMPPGNLAFVHQMDYMFSRSKKLVVILSDEFFSSREHDWQANLAISQDPASKQQRIIPVKYKKINTRNIFDHLGCCDRTRTMREEWFWNKIIKGIKS